MHHVNVTRDIQISKESVWLALKDFAGIYKYNPGVKSSELLSRQPIGVGAQRICHFYDGSSLKETITHYNEQQGYRFELSEFSLPLKKAFTEFSISPMGEHGCRVTVTLSFIPKMGPLGWVMAKVLMKPMLTKALKGLTKGLEDHVKSGLIVSQDGSLVPA